MTHYRFDPERAVFDVSTRPGLAGFSIRATGAAGTVELTVDDKGAIQYEDDVRGSFTVAVRNIETANKLVTAAALQFFGTDQAVVVAGEILGAKPKADDRAGRSELSMRLRVGARDVPAVGAGRLAWRPNGTLEATGDTMVDPRAFGVPLPPLVNLMVHIRWRVGLLADG